MFLKDRDKELKTIRAKFEHFKNRCRRVWISTGFYDCFFEIGISSRIQSKNITAHRSQWLIWPYGGRHEVVIVTEFQHLSLGNSALSSKKPNCSVFFSEIIFCGTPDCLAEGVGGS